MGGPKGGIRGLRLGVLDTILDRFKTLEKSFWGSRRLGPKGGLRLGMLDTILERFNRVEAFLGGDSTKGRGPKGGRNPWLRLRTYIGTGFTALQKSFWDSRAGAGPRGGTGARGLNLDRFFERFRTEFPTRSIGGRGGWITIFRSV